MSRALSVRCLCSCISTLFVRSFFFFLSFSVLYPKVLRKGHDALNSAKHLLPNPLLLLRYPSYYFSCFLYRQVILRSSPPLVKQMRSRIIFVLSGGSNHILRKKTNERERDGSSELLYITKTPFGRDAVFQIAVPA